MSIINVNLVVIEKLKYETEVITYNLIKPTSIFYIRMMKSRHLFEFPNPSHTISQ